ncbi:MAG TPA: hypothetical protein VJ508_18825 [Saprospiraceae bacterium]|nr:hypothetical protein [Saprospiraceae bacterium]
MLGSIRTYFFEKEKQKRLRAGAARRTQFKQGHANHYGILLDAGQTDHRNTVMHFADDLRKKGNRVKILGFVEGRAETMSVPFDLFTSADLAKVSKVPRHALVEAFINQPFDVLINMSIHRNHKALEYISALSHASFRIGPWYHQLGDSPYDLCLDAGDTATLAEWIGELMLTLDKIY